jgi:methyl-accepting chemotaxis protein
MNFKLILPRLGIWASSLKKSLSSIQFTQFKPSFHRIALLSKSMTFKGFPKLTRPLQRNAPLFLSLQKFSSRLQESKKLRAGLQHLRKISALAARPYNFLNSSKVSIRIRLLAAFGVVLFFTVIVGLTGYIGLRTVQAKATIIHESDLASIKYLKDAQIQALYYARTLRDYMIITDGSKMNQIKASMDQYEVLLKTDLDDYSKIEKGAQSIQLLRDFSNKWDTYKTLAKDVMTNIHGDKAELAIQTLYAIAVPQYNDALTILSNLVDNYDQASDDRYLSSIDSFNQTQVALLIFTLLAGLVGIAVAFIISGSISSTARHLKTIATGIARGELDQAVIIHSGDEMGEIAAAFSQIIVYLRHMAATAQKIATGDLTEDIIALSGEDVLGSAFSQMVVHLRGLVGQVAENSLKLAAASEELSSMALQTRLASGQIASTIQQIASGTAQQNEAVTHTVISTGQVSAAIEGVARGAEEQNLAITQVSVLTGQMNATIQRVAANAQNGVKESEKAAQVAQSGALLVNATISGMQSISAKVELSSQKVLEMGSRSDQIGEIVETIGDIASQTNLLALNAAIEAAHAGEYGRGFAVVADEVRKLAEKSAHATKEIAVLVKDIQATVKAAVTAMQAGSAEVEHGFTQAQQSGKALEEILQAAQEVSRQVAEIATAAGQMGSMSDKLVSATDSVSSVVAQNTAATDEMNVSSGKVSQAMNEIARVSAENSASIEQVSASTQQMSAQVDTVNQSATSLEEIASILRQVVSQFRLPAGYTM